MSPQGVHPFEKMIVALARLVKNGQVGATGTLSPIPAAALLLAKHTHAPDLTVLLYGDPDFRINEGLHELFGLIQRGLIDLFFLSGIQIDRFGNFNLSVVGDYQKPTVRLPGGAASNMVTMMARRLIGFATNHTTRLFVPKVDFVNALASDNSVSWRRCVLSHVVTPLGQMKYDQAKGVLVLEAVFPDVSVDEVVRNTGFDLGIEKKEIPQLDFLSRGELEALRGPVQAKLREIYSIFCAQVWGAA
jgi:glutaconate CoA-transferase subunit B